MNGSTTDPLRSGAEAAFRAGLVAADPGPAVARWLRAHPSAAAPSGCLAMAAVGKAAPAMAAGALDERSPDPERSIIVTKDGHEGEAPVGVPLREAGHPTPDARSLAAGEALLDLAAGLGEEDELLLLVSGGASALAEVLPEGISLTDWMAASEALVGGGLPIHRINAVRKHVSRLKGGQLARAAAPARVTALLLSDVIGDDPAVIGSGPAAPDPTLYADALAHAGPLPNLPGSVRAHLERGSRGEIPETPKPKELPNASNHVIAGNGSALEASAAHLRDAGFTPVILTSRLQGEVREVARVLAAVALESADTGRPVAPPVAFFWGGEPTVTLPADGSAGEGGRAQELALALAVALEGCQGIGALSAGTDGTDGPTDAAGGWVDGTTADRVWSLGESPAEVLAAHDSGRLLDRLGDRLITGPTGTNVMDMVLVLVEDGHGSVPPSED